MNFAEELKWRGMVHDMIPGTEEYLKQGMATAYLGFDPTADSLHIGHLVGVMILRHFQRCGHRPIVLIGGATGMIGDPSGKSLERNLLDEETLRHNQEAIRRQLSRLIDFDSSAPNAAVLVNNYDWMKGMGFLEFIRDIGKHITVNYMMAKDSVKKRFNGEGDGMSFTEFTYQLVQGYDFLHLYETMNCKIQLGGADQWGNITTGTELIRRKLGAEAEAFGITCPLITKADGTKFGKTESGNVWLDPRYTSPYKFYQFWINRPDVEMESLLKAFTFLPKAEIERLVEESKTNPGKREAQKTLAWEVTSFVHGEAATQAAIDASGALFGRGGNLEDIDEETLESVLDGFKVVDENGEHVFPVSKPGDRVIDAAQAAGLFKSASEARRAIKSGGVYLNNNRIEDEEQVLAEADFLAGRFALIRRGKKALGAVENR